MEPHVAKTLEVFERVRELGLLEKAHDQDEVKQRIIKASQNRGGPLDAEAVLSYAELLLETDPELNRLGLLDQGSYAHYIERLAALTKGDIEFTDIGDDLWLKPGGRYPEGEYFDEKSGLICVEDINAGPYTTFRVWFTFRGKRYEKEFPQRWDLFPPGGEVSLINRALKEHGIQKRFISIMDIHMEGGGEIYARPDQVKPLQDEGLIGKYPKITPEAYDY